MPTGYTATLMEKGQSFPEFAMLCARAMGATIMMRDDDLDTPIPEFEPSDYNTKQLAIAENELARLRTMPNSDRIKFGAKARRENISRYQQWISKSEAEDQRLRAMAAQVTAWDAPSTEHEGLKAFMLDQLKISLNGTEYQMRELRKAESQTDIEYYRDAVAEATRSVEYNTKGDIEERERTAKRNQWVRQLRESLSNK